MRRGVMQYTCVLDGSVLQSIGLQSDSKSLGCYHGDHPVQSNWDELETD